MEGEAVYSTRGTGRVGKPCQKSHSEPESVRAEVPLFWCWAQEVEGRVARRGERRGGGEGEAAESSVIRDVGHEAPCPLSPWLVRLRPDTMAMQPGAPAPARKPIKNRQRQHLKAIEGRSRRAVAQRRGRLALPREVTDGPPHVGAQIGDGVHGVEPPKGAAVLGIRRAVVLRGLDRPVSLEAGRPRRCARLHRCRCSSYITKGAGHALRHTHMRMCVHTLLTS